MITAEDKLRWILEVLSIPNQLLSLAEKATLIMARFEIDTIKHEPDRENRTTLYVPKIAERNGLSRYTVGNSLKTLAEKGIIEREVYFPVADGNTQFDKKRVAVAFPAMLLSHPKKLLASIDLPARNHGGKRVAFICKHCKSIGTQIKMGYRCFCEECGKDLFYTSDSAYLLTEEQLERME